MSSCKRQLWVPVGTIFEHGIKDHEDFPHTGGEGDLSRLARLAGKPAKVALTACMRKILVILNAMLKNRTYWNPQLHLAA